MGVASGGSWCRGRTELEITVVVGLPPGSKMTVPCRLITVRNTRTFNGTRDLSQRPSHPTVAASRPLLQYSRPVAAKLLHGRSIAIISRVVSSVKQHGVNSPNCGHDWRALAPISVAPPDGRYTSLKTLSVSCIFPQDRERTPAESRRFVHHRSFTRWTRICILLVTLSFGYRETRIPALI
jgi:hypothetical protein